MKRIDYPKQKNNFSNEIAEIQKLLGAQTPDADNAVTQTVTVPQTSVASESSPSAQLTQQQEIVHYVTDEPAHNISERSQKKQYLWIAPLLVVLIGSGMLLFMHHGDSDKNSSLGTGSVVPALTTLSTTTTSEIYSSNTSNTVTDPVMNQATTGYDTTLITTTTASEPSVQTPMTTLTTTTTTRTTSSKTTSSPSATTTTTTTETDEPEITSVDADTTITPSSDDNNSNNNESSNVDDG